MCNINILINKNKNKKIVPFLMSTTAHSFINNNDGEGFYTESNNQTIKSKNKIDYFKYKSTLEASKMIITHQRKSTSGFELEYNHPFENDNFVLVHNGIINQFKKKLGSDTYGFWLDFNKKFNSYSNKLNRTLKITKAINELLLSI